MTPADRPLLEHDEIKGTFDNPDGVVEALRGVALPVYRGECLGVLGESGSGKTETFLEPFHLSPAKDRAVC
ncbi:MAG: ABC transporter ATP-binding protein, partial [Hyphomonadaceae bacterium]